MNQHEWDVYAGATRDAVLYRLLCEEIAELERRGGKTYSKGQAKKRNTATVIFAAVCLALVALFGLASIVFLFWAVVIYLIYMMNLHKKGIGSGRIKLLKKTAMRFPDKPLRDIVAEDCGFVEERKFFSKPAFSAIVLALAAVLGFAAGTEPVLDSVSSSGNDSQVIATEAPNLRPEAEYTWEQGEKGYILVDFDAGTEEVNPNIPAEIDGIPVVAIGERAFENETTLTSVVIPGSVTEIGSYAFKNCASLTSITMGDQVISIGGEAFKGCTGLTEITVPAGVTEIRGNTFEGCTRLARVNLHEGITAIHAYAFNHCRALESITLPSGITEIRANTFEGCVSLTSIHIPEGVTRIAAHAFRGCSALAEVDVPGTVAEIGSSAFRECDSLKEICLPMDCVVNERAFKDSPTKITRG